MTVSSLLRSLGTRAFDLIITDLRMPAVIGFGLIASLRQAHPRTPIIAMTGWGPLSQTDALKADTVLQKPFELEELDHSIRELLVSSASGKD